MFDRFGCCSCFVGMDTGRMRGSAGATGSDVW